MGEALRRRLKQSSFPSPQMEAAINVLVAADNIRQRIACACREADLTQGQYNVLRILRGAQPEGHPRCEIAMRMVEPAPDVTRLVDRLEKRGLVERSRCDEDRRLSLTRITPAGLAMLDRLEPPLAALWAEIEGRLSPGEADELSRLCEKIYSDG